MTQAINRFLAPLGLWAFVAAFEWRLATSYIKLKSGTLPEAERYFLWETGEWRFVAIGAVLLFVLAVLFTLSVSLKRKPQES